MGRDATGPGRAFTTEQIQLLVDTAVNPFVVIDLEGVALWAGESVSELLGISAHDLVGRSMLEFVGPGSIDAAVHALASAAEENRTRGEVPREWEGTGPVFELMTVDGRLVSCAIAVATPARTGLPCFVLQLRRADPSHALEDALLAMGTDQPLGDVLARVAAVLRGELPDVEVVILHGDPPTPQVGDPAGGEYRFAEDLPSSAPGTWTKATAHPGEVVERSVDELPTPLGDWARAAGFHWLSLLATAPVIEGDPSSCAVVCVWSRSTFRMHFLNHDRLHRCSDLVTMALRWEYGRRALRWAATHDGLTGLHNRASFLRELHAAGGARRRSTDPTVVLYLDLDDFKPINDEHGHTLGDQVLVEVAQRLHEVVRPSDLVARLGGDEFAVLCPGLAEIGDAEQLAHRLVTEVGTPMDVDGVSVRVGLSIGIAVLDEDEDVERVLNRADDALRQAKLDGKSRWQVA